MDTPEKEGKVNDKSQISYSKRKRLRRKRNANKGKNTDNQTSQQSDSTDSLKKLPPINTQINAEQQQIDTFDQYLIRSPSNEGQRNLPLNIPEFAKNVNTNLELVEKVLDKVITEENTVFLDIGKDVSDKVVKMEKQTSEKSREEIMAEREAKKLAKQLVKNKKMGDQSNPVAVKSNEIKNTTPSKGKEFSQIQIKKQQTTDFSGDVSKVEKQGLEKSREEIMAEREAKKLNKQLSKNKKKEEKSNSAPVTDNLPVTESKNTSSKVKESTTSKNEKQKLSDISEKENQNIKMSVNQQPSTEKLTSSEGQEKSKSELRAERRAKQEAQRAAKAQLLADKDNSKTVEKNKNESEKPKPTRIAVENSELRKSPLVDKTKLVQNKHKVKLFNHLYTEDDEKFQIPLNSKDIPPIVVRLGVQYKNGIIVGSNARCVALLSTLLKVIKDYVVPVKEEFSRGLEAHLDICMKFLNSCRPLAVSMINAMKYLKSKLRKLPHDIEEDDAKSKMCEFIDVYILEQIEIAGKAISNSVNEKIANGDVILTYGCSSLIEKILVDASENPNKVFSVVVVTANPWNEGSEMLRRLVKRNIKCSLVMISALSFVMRKIDKVILGAGALLANGYVMARAGTAQVAMVAHAYNVPVLVCCETHKFSEKAQTDSFVYNEIGSPDDLFKCNPGPNGSTSNWRAYDTLTPLHLKYDVTPPDLVNAVVTELAILPCTSVPVVLRVRPTDL